MKLHGSIDLHKEFKIPASVTTLVIIYNFCKYVNIFKI